MGLLWISYQHELLATYNGDKGNRRVTLACLIYNHHVEHSLRSPQLVGRDAGCDHHQKYSLKFFHMLRLTQILRKGR